MKVARQWYRVENVATDPTVADIHIIDIIGDWVDELINEYYGITATVTAKAFVDMLSKLPDAVTTIRVHINSPGGDVFAAVNIANALREQQLSKNRTVETIVDGLAASAASIIMMAGTAVRIADNGMVMVHNPWSVAMGTSADMRKSAEMLDAVRNTIVATYQWHSTLDAAALIALMDAETWMDADQAVENGFATEKVAGLKAAASIDPTGVRSFTVPDKFKARVDALLKPAPAAPQTASAADVLAAVDAAGLGTALARELVAAALPMADVTARIAQAVADRAAIKTREDGIRAACTLAKRADLADQYVTGGMSLEAVKAQLVTITAIVDRAEIDTTLKPQGGASPAGARALVIDAYTKLNQSATKGS